MIDYSLFELKQYQNESAVSAHAKHMMVEIFKTNIPNREQANKMLILLGTSFGETRFNFDLNDCDKILRAEAVQICATKIIAIMNEFGFDCHLLD